MTSNGLGARVRDTDGLARYILDNLGDVEQEFYEFLVREVAEQADITLTASRLDLTVRKLQESGLDLGGQGVEAAVLEALTGTSRESEWAPFVDTLVQDRGIALNFRRRELVLSTLDRLAVDAGPNRQALIAQVIDDVTRGSGTDPVQLTRPVGRTSAWDFQVDLFDSTSGQVVLADNVRAAGALMWCYDIGERLGVFKLTDALVYRWWVGLVDFGDADLTSELYRYYKLRDERPVEEERFLLYRRILDLGGAPVGERVVINSDFPQLWRSLMEEVALHIDRSETSFRDRINTQGVVQAIQEIQYNLTERMAGMALTQVTEMYNQLRQTEIGTGVLGALDILDHPEVVGQLSSGRRRNQWSVIERIAKEEFGVSPNVNALRTSAVEGFKVVDYIADFRSGALDEDAFEDFISSAKAWILAQQLAGEGLLVDAGDGSYEDDGDEASYDEFGDDLEDVVGPDDDSWSE